jgi:hypothetical protein
MLLQHEHRSRPSDDALGGGSQVLADVNDRSVGDPHQLSRFVQAQEHHCRQALNEIRSGRKSSHWMWYIFPQFDGLGFSSTSRYYSIKSRA